jgi:hypothetical protein
MTRPASALLSLDHRPTAVMTAIRADDVGRNRSATFWTGLQLLGLKAMMRAAHPGAGI